AQHRQMLDQVMRLFDIRPDYDLDVMSHNQSPTQVAAAVLSGMEHVLEQERPDWVIVQGDTTTVAAASLATYYNGARLAHVEAGLRTYDKWQPFPEEMNRRVAGVLADVHFAPTERARRNLLAEGIVEANVHVTGNTAIDALRLAFERAGTPSLPPDLACLESPQQKEEPRLVLVTAHRRENFGVIEEICEALKAIALRYGSRVHIVYPVHLNPNIRQPVRALLDGLPNVTLTEPLDYLPMVQLMRQAYLILTDSGGIQEEAPGLGKPVLVLREVTERPEAIEAGTVKLVGTDPQKIVSETIRLMEDREEYESMSRAVNPYGDGHASERIVA